MNTNEEKDVFKVYQHPSSSSGGACPSAVTVGGVHLSLERRDKIPIEQTSIPSHLDQMVVLLQEEENSAEKGSMGPCMEYLLQHKLMETLYSLGRTDVPKNLTSNPQSLSTETDAQNKGATVPVCQKQDFSLVTSLLNLSRSADSRVAVKACEGLMLCVSLPEETAAMTIVNDTPFCQELSQRLVEAYLKLPSYVNPADLEFVQAKWGLDVVTDIDDQQSFLGKRQLISFLSWLDYCDQLIAIANPVIAKALARSIRQLFLDVIMEPSVLQTSETGAILATAYLTRCLRTISSQALLSEFCNFILGEDRRPEILSEETHRVCLVTLKLFDTLLLKEDEYILHNLVLRNLLGRGYYLNIEENCDQSEERTSQNNISQNADKCNEIVNTNGENSPEKSHEQRNNSDDTKRTASHGNDKENDIKDSKPLELDQNNETTNGSVSADPSDSVDSTLVNGAETSPFSLSPASSPFSSPAVSPKRNRPEVLKIVNSFLSLLPEELKSSYQTADSGYDMYVKDANKQFKDVMDMCRMWGWPENAVTDKNYEVETFYEGAFLKMLLDKLSHMMDQSYAMNLQLTSVLSKLALIPHPNLHEYLLDPFLPVKDGTKTLFAVFRKVCFW
ncbi:hypothetical protein KUTeg_005324 [Tegillarca granosa]|uniref:FHF complex subunit HOOK-interacting protein C-terminal domain-containing protein n=1 Tax=Tegillarca granosa TaxID=220873 RepID=A0ABQ9FJF4_TEGGR|nr:hypothetical protein KUTeg_005324 [Tegillarca granosa]